MQKNKILVIGFGIDANRTEAVSLNTIKLIKQLKSMGQEVTLVTIGYPNNVIDAGSSMPDALLRRTQICQNLVELIDRLGINVIHDVFVLPLASQLFTLRLKKLRPKLRIIKEVHNDAGFSRHWHAETLIRLLANSAWSLNQVLAASRCYTRNHYLAQKYHLPYVPQPITVQPMQRRDSKQVRLSYLGHPLRKKGIFEFPKLMSLLAKTKVPAKWSFALSQVGDAASVQALLSNTAQALKVPISFRGKVVPHAFFSHQDYYFLPIQDQYGAISTPNTILEAMEAGAICIVTNIPSLEGIVLPNETGIVVPTPTAQSLFEAWLQVHQNPQWQQKIRRQARAFIQQNFSEKVIVQKIKVLYAT